MIGVFIFLYLFIAFMVLGITNDEYSLPIHQAAILAIWWPVALVVWLLIFLGKGHYDLIRSLLKK